MKIITLSEMLHCLAEMKHPEAALAIKAAEQFADGIATKLANHLGVRKGRTTFEGLEEGGLACSFGPRDRGQPCPEEFEPYDEGSGPEDNNWEDDE